MIEETDYQPATSYETRWGIGIYNEEGHLTRVRFRRERLFDPRQPFYTEETVRHDREHWVRPGGAWAFNPDLIRVVSQTIKPWKDTP